MKTTDKCKNCRLELRPDFEQVGGVHMGCEFAYFKDKTELRYQVWLEGYENNKCVVEQHELDSMLCETWREDSDAYVVRAHKYTKHEIEIMPEFTGF